MQENEAKPCPAPTLRARAGMLDRETTWTLLPHGLQAEVRNRPAQVVAYEDIVEVRLQFSASREHQGRCLCGLRTRDGHAFTLVSTHCKGFLRFENRAESYAPLVRELVRKVAKANPQVKLHAGASPVQYYGLAVFLVAVVLLLAWAVDIPGRLVEGGWGGWIRLAAVVAVVPVAWGFLRANHPRSFTADDIPPGLLPGGLEKR